MTLFNSIRYFSLSQLMSVACRLSLLLCVAIAFQSCDRDDGQTQTPRLYEKVEADQTGISFINQLTFNDEFNIYTYRNYYNGGGVGLGDFNNDGLIDIYFTANMLPNKLYLNKGGFKFEDITGQAGVAGTRAWSTGVSLADVNGDGWLDIYVCNSGDIEGDNKQNELFINNGDLTFTEKAEEYGIADPGYTTHAAFFDYDKDGDLDAYILNNSYQAIGSFNLRKNQRPQRDKLGGDKLMRNDNGRFVDVSEEAGIYGSVIGFGLGITVGDINMDGWIDIYVSNDFFERDYLYINNHDGTFSESLTSSMKSVSGASMGADLADINNDGAPDIFVTEMLPRDNERLKTVTTFEDWNRYQYNIENGYYHQFTRNMFQINLGKGVFTEQGRLAGVEASDWSWGALLFDMDNDAKKDIFVANGIYQDLTNQDFLQFASSEDFAKSVISKQGINYRKLVEIIPSHPVSNYAFQNQGSNLFNDKAGDWGLSEPSFSNGSAYGDLDNDGDLDLVVNNVNMPPFVYKNQSDTLMPRRHYLKFILKGEAHNTQAVGTKITVYHRGLRLYYEQMPVRGFESSVDPRPNVGLDTLTRVDSVAVQWPDGRVTTLTNVKADQTITLVQKDAVVAQPQPVKSNEDIFSEIAAPPGMDFIHKENPFVDFDRDRLIFHMLSTEDARIAVGDVNGDKLDDVYFGGAKDQAGALYIQTAGGFRQSSADVFARDKVSEDTAPLFFDVDNDGDLDLYVCSGGNEFPTTSTALLDRLYMNDGKGNFTKSAQRLPTTAFESTSCAVPADFDADGDLDLFVGVRFIPFQYGLPVNGYILRNDGSGKLTNATSEVAPQLSAVGMITDATWADVDGDGDPDLIVVGEWMQIKVFVNTNGKLVDESEARIPAFANGWWNVIEGKDLDQDGDIDFVVGNHGLNSRFRASPDRPVCMYVNDFDKNGSQEQILCTFNGEKSYPMALRHDLISQLPGLKKKYLKYESYKDQTIEDIFTPEERKGALKLDVQQLQTVMLINDGKGNFSMVNLPVEAQVSPVYALLLDDLDGDNNVDILLGGNLYNTKPEVGRYDASFGTFLKGDGKGGFECVPSISSGLLIDGEVRDMKIFKFGGKRLVLVSRVNDKPTWIVVR